jgi:hypothetical protein
MRVVAQKRVMKPLARIVVITSATPLRLRAFA